MKHIIQPEIAAYMNTEPAGYESIFNYDTGYNQVIHFKYRSFSITRLYQQVPVSVRL